MFKICRICGETRAIDDFYRATGMADGFEACEACNLGQRARRYREDPKARARDLARVRRWPDDNAERHNETKSRLRACPDTPNVCERAI